MTLNDTALLALRHNLWKAQKDKRLLEAKREKLDRSIAKKDEEINDLQKAINEGDQ